MENQQKPLLNRPSMAPKTNLQKKVKSKSLPTMGASTWFLCVNLYVLLQSLSINSQTFTKNWQKSHKTWQESKQGSSECFHVPFILVLVVLKGFCETCAKNGKVT